MINPKATSRYSLVIVTCAIGFAANLAQVSLFRFFMGLFYGTEMHLGMFLGIWLAGISTGGFVGGKKSLSLKWLLRLIVATITFSAAVVFFGHAFLPDPAGGYLPYQPVVLFMLVCIFPVSFLIGMLLPVLIRESDRSLGEYYGYEAIGGFFGGIFFSIILGGTANSMMCLISIPIIVLSAMTLISPDYIKPSFLVFILLPAIYFYGPDLVEKIENNYWKMANKNLTLVKTAETPYQKLQLCSYHEQMSLFSNGMFSCSWPLSESAEKKVHSFVSALKSTDEVLVLGAPTPDVVKEFLKYPGLKLTIVELDQKVIDFYSYSNESLSRCNILTDDPRRFLNTTQVRFDGILIYPVSPVTLAGNRLFTIEAFKAVKNCLKPTGVLSLEVAGTENYLGSIKEQIILSTWQALARVFPEKYAFPGSTITFFACQEKDVIPQNVKGFMKRFSSRKITTSTFFSISFFNILMPFRVSELEKWLNKPIVAKLNTDAHPESFGQQLELWNVYSGTSTSRPMRWLQARTLNQLIVFVFMAGLLCLVPLLMIRSASSIKSAVAGGVSISGATGLFCEIILILLYQNSHGAAYQMSAFFFGVYMLGLAAGAWLFSQLKSGKSSFRRLKKIKVMQAFFTFACIILVDQTQLHGVITIASAIFLIAFLDGIEFPIADSILRSLGKSPADSAGLLLFSDNTGALIAGLISGLWLLPVIGMKGSFLLLASLLVTNLIILLVLSKRFQDEQGVS